MDNESLRKLAPTMQIIEKDITHSNSPEAKCIAIITHKHSGHAFEVIMLHISDSDYSNMETI